MTIADQRVHGTTHEAPMRALRARRARAPCARCRSRALPRRSSACAVASRIDAFVDVDTVRYSVPHRLVRDHVEVVIEEQIVRIFHGTELVATHARSREPFARVVDPAHFAGLVAARPARRRGRADTAGRRSDATSPTTPRVVDGGQ